MKKTYPKKMLAPMLILFMLVAFFGCSGSSIDVPVPHSPEPNAQLKTQAVEHWRDMAEDVAQRVLKAFEDREDILDRPIYIAMPNNRPFTIAFYSLLRTELVSRGLQVSLQREPNTVVLEYNVQAIYFDSSRLDTGVGFSFGTNNNPRVTSGSNHEIIVNAKLYYKNRFVMHCSASRYINDADWALYIDPQMNDPMAESSKNIRVIKK